MITLNAQQYLIEVILILSRYFKLFFILSFSFLLSLFNLLCAKRHHTCNLYCILYTLSFFYVMYYIVLEIFITGNFLEDYFCCYSQLIICAEDNKSLIPYNLIKRAPEHRTFKTATPNSNLNQIQKYKIQLSF